MPDPSPPRLALLDLRTFCPATDLPSAWMAGPAFVELRPAEPARGPDLIDELDDNPDRAWKRHLHWKQPAAEVPAIGCYFLRDVALWAPGVAIHDRRLLTQESETDKQAQSTLPDLGADGFFAGPAPIDRVIDRPVLIADGLNHRIWGHFLVEYLPRFAIAREQLGPLFDELAIPLPDTAPGWVDELLALTCGVRPEAIIRYRPMAERLICARAVQPAFCNGHTFTFHSFLADYLGRLRPVAQSGPTRICVSRGGSATAGSTRRFPLRQTFEDLATAHGYTIVRPEEHAIAAQIALFATADIIVGEFGSGMHNALFSRPGTIVGCIGFWNPIQLHIGFVCRQRSVYLTQGCRFPSDENPYFQLDPSADSLRSFFERIEEISAE